MNKRRNWIFAYVIAGIYILYPGIYLYAFHGRDDYVLINNFDRLVVGIWLTVGLLSLVSVIQTLATEKNSRSYLPMIVCLILALLFGVYAFIPPLFDFVLSS